MKLRLFAGALSITCLVHAPLAAQDLTIAFEPSHAAQGIGLGGMAQGPEIGLVAIEPFDLAPAVENAPYTAEAITESTQLFADGNRIEQRTAAKIARDSSGRVRREHHAMMFGGLVTNKQAALVSIIEPTGLHITLDAERRVAHRVKMPAAGRDLIEVGAAGPGVPVAAPVVEGSFHVRIADGPPPGADNVHVMVNRTGDLPVPAPGVPLGGDLKTEQLPEQMIEGVKAQGTRTTQTIAANAIGNQLPIVIVSERWYSPELQIVVLTRRSDPRFGETVYRLVNINRGEPAAELFEIPGDYRIIEPVHVESPHSQPAR